jgi:hypothetical protein
MNDWGNLKVKGNGLSHRKIAKALESPRNAIGKYLADPKKSSSKPSVLRFQAP